MHTTDSHANANDEILANVVNRIGFIEFNRHKALNALSINMIRSISAALDRWRDDENVLAVVVHSKLERAFCAGGDVRYLYESTHQGRHNDRNVFFTEEYRLVHAISTYPKPYIALMNGVVMGGGMGISQGAVDTGGLRVVTQSTKMAMPETRIGLFPDVGASSFLAKTPGAIGQYLAITGETVGAADALYAGLADLYISDEALPALLNSLNSQSFERAAEVVAFIRDSADSYQVEPAIETSVLALSRKHIDRHFAVTTVNDALLSLQQESSSDGRPWAEQIILVVRDRSPLSMAVALKLVTHAEDSLADVLRRDLDLTVSSFEMGDCMEGVRARIIDKDNAPRWRFQRVEDVHDEDVRKMFRSPWSQGEHPLKDLQD
jgi:enoyl-CoA hydratase/carnithine racemase